MPSRIRPDDLDSDDYYTQQDYGRRHRSQPPKKDRVKEKDRHQRPRFAKDDSYYSPRDKYYLSDDGGPDFHPYFATRRDDSPPRHRAESPPRDRYESPAGYASPTRYESPLRRRGVSPSRDRRLPRSPTRSHSAEDRARHRRHSDEGEYAPRSRQGVAASKVGSSRRRSSTTLPPPESDRNRDHRRSSTTVPPPESDRNRDHRRSRRDTSRYPPSSSKSHGAKRSLTQPARRRSSSRSPSPGSPRGRRRSQEVFTSAAKAALEAGAAAALKVHNDQGPWLGAKGTKVATTALGAALVDAFFEHRKPEMKGSKTHGLAKQAATFALGNLVTKPAAKRGLGGHHVQKGMQ